MSTGTTAPDGVTLGSIMGRKHGRGPARGGAEGAIRIERTPAGRFGVAIDMSKAPIPEPHVEADHWWAFERDGAVSLVFDQVPARGEILVRIEGRMSYEGFMALAVTLDGDAFRTKFSAYMQASAGLPGPSTPKPSADAKAAVHQVVRIGAVRLGHNGSEAEAMLFAISPNEVGLAVRSEGAIQARVHPLLRVGGTTQAMASLVDDCRRLAKDIGPRIGRLPQEGPAE